MEKKSQTGKPPKPPASSPENAVPGYQPGWWESLSQGWKTPDMPGGYQGWVDYALSQSQWLAKYPSKTDNDFRMWRRKMQKQYNSPENWLTRLLPTKRLF